MTHQNTHVPARPVLLGALASEAVKLWTLRSHRALAVAALLVVTGSGALLSISLRTRTTDPRFAGQTVVAEPMQFVDSVLWAQVLLAVLAALAVTGEYTSGQARLSLLAVPTRPLWLTAKVLVIATTGFLVGAVGAASALGLSALILSGSEVVYAPQTADVVGLAARSGAYLAAVMVLVTGLAAALRRVVASLTAALGLLVMVPPLLSSVPALRALADYTPTYAGRRLISDLPTTAQLEPWAGFGVLGLWAALAVLTAGVLLTARDA